MDSADEVDPDSRGWRFFQRELAHQWSPRNRRFAVLGLAAVLVVQAVVSAALQHFIWGKPAGLRLEIPSVLSMLLFPFASPLTPLWANSLSEMPPVWVALQLSQWMVLIVIQFIGPIFAARAVAPDRENKRLQELILAGLPPRLVVGAKSGAAVFPFVVLALAVGLLGAGLLFGAHIAGRHDLVGTWPPTPPNVIVPPRPDLFASQCVLLAVSVVRWLSVLALMGAIGAACRNSRVAMGWCYALPFLIHPFAQYALTRLVAPGGSLLGGYRFALTRGIVSVAELAVAAFLFRGAVEALRHPEEDEPWVDVPCPAIWDLSLSDPPDDERMAP